MKFLNSSFFLRAKNISPEKLIGKFCAIFANLLPAELFWVNYLQVPILSVNSSFEKNCFKIFLKQNFQRKLFANTVTNSYLKFM